MPPWTRLSSPFPPVSACNNCSGSRRGSEPKPNGTSSMSLKSSSLRAIDSRHRSRAPAGTSPTPRVTPGPAATRTARSAAGSAINPDAGAEASSQPAPVGQGAVFEPDCDPSAVSMQSVISVTNLSKTYASGFRALKNVSLDIRRGEIFALLGPNGAGKTTLIGIICGIVNPSEGRIRVDGHDLVADRGRRRRAEAGYVEAGALAPGRRRDHHSDHPLHRRGRRDGRTDRGDQQRRDHPGGRQGRVDAQARQETIDVAPGENAGAYPACALRLPPRAGESWKRTDLYVRRAGRPDRHDRAAAGPDRDGHPVQGSADDAKLARGHLRHPGERQKMSAMNVYAIRAIYKFEMSRTRRTLMQSIIAPVISTALYFVVFGAAIGGRISEVEGVTYGAFIVPGLVMLSLLTQSISNASFGIYFPKFTGTIYELLSAPVSYLEIVVSYVGAAATKSVVLGLIILATAALLVPLRVEHPVWMMLFLVLTAVTFSLVGFIIGIWADGFEKLQLVPLLIVTPLTFLGGSFYSVDMLPPFWQTVTLFNPVVYLISGFRWSFYGLADVSVGVSLAMTVVFLAVSLAIVAWIFKTGYRLKT